MYKTALKLDGANNLMQVVDDYIYIASDHDLVKVDKKTYEIVKLKKVFPKNGKSRAFIVDGKNIYFREFCNLYRIDTKSFEITYEWKLGLDLTSDICGMSCDDKNVYVGIRNGPLAVINKNTTEVSYHNVSNSSIWAIEADDYLYAGNVDGDLIVIDKDSLEMVEQIKLHKKNLKSLIVTDDKIYTASQDLSFSILDKETLKTLDVYKKCHKKMFYLVGVRHDHVITASKPCGEMKIWDMKNKELRKTIAGASWNMTIDDKRIYYIRDDELLYTELNEIR